MSGSITFYLFLIVLSGGIYYLLGHWASGRLYDKGYPAWTGWVIALTGFIPTLILVNVLPSKRAERDRRLMLTAEMELARQNAGIPMAGYANQTPPVWAPNSSPFPPAGGIQPVANGFSQPGLPPAGGIQPVANGFSQPGFPPPGHQKPVHQRAPVGAGFVSPQWVPSEPQAALPARTRRCEGCEFLVAPGRSTCPNCGLLLG